VDGFYKLVDFLLLYLQSKKAGHAAKLRQKKDHYAKLIRKM